MNITPVNYQYQYQYRNINASKAALNQAPAQMAFTGVRAEKSMQKGEYALRIIANKIGNLFQSKKVKELTKTISEITPESSPKYLSQLEGVSRIYASNKIIDVNIEDKILEQIAQSGKSTIFIMNHSNQSEDPQMLAVLNTILTQAYQDAGRGESFPVPKIILNQDILTTMDPIKRKAFEAVGAVGVDANISSRDIKTNARAMFPLMRDFISDKCNIFIFPEGRLAVRKDLELFQRFQGGVAEIINKILGVKKEVTVVPVGFAYGKGENKKLTGMHIGKPIIFKRDKDITTTTSGSIPNSEFADSGFAQFFEKHKDETDVVLTKDGQPLGKREVTDYIKDILSENLGICAKEADKKVIKPIDENEIEIF